MKYAQERYVTVIPEIDLPGHMLAALAAYPNWVVREVLMKWHVIGESFRMFFA